MISLNIIKEQYARMANDELLHFAINESQYLTIDSFRLLLNEFKARDLDISVLESVETDKLLSKLNIQSSFEKNAASDFEQSLFDYAMTERKKGKHNIDIYYGLLQKGLTEEYAFIFVQSLNWRVKCLVESYDNNLILGYIFMSVGFIIITLYLMEYFKGFYVLYGLFLIVAGIWGTIINSLRKKRYQAILKNLESDELKINTSADTFNDNEHHLN